MVKLFSQQHKRKGILFMIIRKAWPEETERIIREGYKVWSKNRTFERYDTDNRKEDAYGTRYIAEDNGEIVSSLILLRLAGIGNREVFGIGSVLTPSQYRNRGYAAALLEFCLEQIKETHGFIFLYSEIAPSFYEKFRFRPLPDALQKEKAVCMVLCDEAAWTELTRLPVSMIPDYF